MLDVDALRAEFPALSGRQIFLDGPAGTQVPNPVIRAINEALTRSMSNVGGQFASSRRSEEVVARAREAGADLVNGSLHEIVFGQNMTSLTFALSRALAETWKEGDRIILSAIDHDANITPWVRAAASKGVLVDFVDFDRETTALDLDQLESMIDQRTRLVAVTGCSNAFGTTVDVARVARAAKAVGALTFVDAVHLAPHRRIDVEAIECDFLVCSSYKFFGPHLGIMWARADHLERLPAFKVRPAPDQGPARWETGTAPFELLAGFTAAVDYLASLGWGAGRRGALDAAFAEIGSYEAGLGDRFLAGLPDRVTVVGQATMKGRVPTFAVAVDALPAAEVARQLGNLGIATWAGHYYAVEPMARLGLLESGGLTRIGFVHVSTAKEVDVTLAALSNLES
ncbi:MAG: cysteine desulfurase-like protein [Acidimicrobiia bacterium]